jgi:hypothetical protein
LVTPRRESAADQEREERHLQARDRQAGDQRRAPHRQPPGEEDLGRQPEEGQGQSEIAALVLLVRESLVKEGEPRQEQDQRLDDHRGGDGRLGQPENPRDAVHERERLGAHAEARMTGREPGEHEEDLGDDGRPGGEAVQLDPELRVGAEGEQQAAQQQERLHPLAIADEDPDRARGQEMEAQVVRDLEAGECRGQENLKGCQDAVRASQSLRSPEPRE